MKTVNVDRRDFLRMFAAAAALSSMPGASFAAAEEKDKKGPNIILFTVDDMDITSVNCYGNPLKGLTPNMDKLASQGLRFLNAHVSSAICMPCRQSMMTGLHPHSNDSYGFVEVPQGRFPSLPELLTNNGYYTVSISKGRDYHAFKWDKFINGLGGDGWYSRKPQAFYDITKESILEARQKNKPFFIGVNTSDPHRPFAGSEQEKEFVAQIREQYPSAPDFPEMEPVCDVDEVPLLPYLPDLPDIRKETVQYLTCVKRADDTLGRIMELIDEMKLKDDTIFIFLSDHDAAMPTAKQNCYCHSTKTPLIIRWPGKIEPATSDSEHMVSTIDIMPTILEALGIDIPEKQDGRSMLDIWLGGKQSDRDFVFTTYNYYTPGMQVFPMRAVHTKNWSYIFNPWSDGKNKRLQKNGQPTENQSGLTFEAMQKAAIKDPEMRKRLNYILLRRREELFDLANDPYSFNNLSDEPDYAGRKSEMKLIMAKAMVQTDDPLLKSLLNGGSYPQSWNER